MSHVAPRRSRLAALVHGLERINAALGRAVGMLVLAMVLLQFTVVLLRYLFGFSHMMLQEGVLYMHAVLFMLAAGYTLLIDGHVRVDVFYGRLRPRGKAWVDLLGGLVLLMPPLVVLAYYSWPSVRNSWAVLEGAISVGGIPASFLLKTLVPAFCVVVGLQGVAMILRAGHLALTGTPLPDRSAAGAAR
ncbi:TRAP transporter small permease subunit [Salinarimonas chemoclinalis]|uniref:TRAP transporter small permease subunit n=1 Tax=Salinarimonas chemoclinalis TaxID=3241599 RepID=UPI0035560568